MTDKNDSFVGEVFDETKKAQDELLSKAAMRKAGISMAKQAYLNDPLKRLQSFELGLIINLVLAVASYFLSKILAGLLMANFLWVAFKYYKERKAYEEVHGKL